MTKLALLLTISLGQAVPFQAPGFKMTDPPNPTTGAGCDTYPFGGQACGEAGGGITLTPVDGGVVETVGPLVWASNADARTSLSGVANIASVGSFDSLIDSDPTALALRQICSSPLNIQPAASVDSDGFLAADLNPQGLTGGEYLTAVFTLPSGLNSAKLTARMKKGAADTGTTGLAYDATSFNCGLNSGSTTATLTSSFANYSLTMTGLTATTNYWPLIALNQTGFGASATSDPILQWVQVSPVGGTGFWASDFWRLDANPQTLWYNTRSSYYPDGTFKHGPQVELVLDTDATQIEVEQENTTTDNADLSLVVWVDGRPWTTLAPSAGSTNGQMFGVTLPTGIKRVEIGAGTFTQGATNAGPDQHEGTYLRAVYVPAAATTYVEFQPQAAKTLILYGDSITQGHSAPVPMAGGWARQLRRWYPGNVYVEAWGSRQLSADVGGTSLTYLPQLVELIASAHPSEMWSMMGINDYLSATMTQAQFGTAYGAFLDALHVRMPGLKVFAALLLTGEESTANSNGDTPINFRSQINTACSARPWCVYIDGTTLLASADIGADHIHPVAGAEYKLAGSIFSNLTSASFSATPTVQQFAGLTLGDGGTEYAHSSGTITIDKSNTGTATVSAASSGCVCSIVSGTGDAGCAGGAGTPIAQVSCSLSGTTLTANFSGNCTGNVNYFCP